MDHVLQLNEFFVEGGRQEESHVLLHISEPSTPEEKQKGYFFAICEIDHATTEYIKELQDIIDEVENDYYETPDNGEKNALEIVLERANQRAYALIKPELSLHCVIGIIRQPEIIFSYYGTPQLLLFYKNRQGSYQRMNLLDSSEEESVEQLFSQVVQGKISPGDYLFAGTPHLTNYFSADRLEKIITTRPARQSAEHIERVLSELKSALSFGGLIIHLARATEQTGAPVKKLRPALTQSSVTSLSNLFTTEKNTANTLSPSFFPRLNHKLKTLLQKPEAPPRLTEQKNPSYPITEINAAHAAPRRASPPPSSATNPQSSYAQVALRILGATLTYLGKFLAWCGLALYSLLHGVIRVLVLLFFAAINYKNRRQSILEDWGRQWRSHKENLRQLPLVTKLLLIGSLLVATIFIGSVVYLRAHAKTVAERNTFLQNIQLIRTKKDAAESFLVYDNEVSALEELRSADDILEKIDCDKNPEDAKTCADLERDLESVLTRVRKITTVKPELVVDWGANSAVGLKSLVKINSRFFAVSPTSSNLFRYDLVSREQATLPTGVRNTGFADAAVPKENDYGVFIYNQKELLQLNPEDSSALSADISYPANEVTLTSAVVYNRRLYSVDTKNNQIYRHDSIKTGFAQGKDWIKDGTNVRDGVDIAIDGDVWVLKDNGQIIKFANGQSQPFAMQGLDPALGKGGKLWTYTDVNNLYLLDHANKRLIILEKDGRLKKQLTAPEFDNLGDMVIDEPNKTAYVVNGTKLYKITLP